jgi:N-acetylmuramoyl-L-alanine amidase
VASVGWRGCLAAGVLIVLGPAGARAVEVQRLETATAPGKTRRTIVRVVLSQPVQAAVHRLSGGPDAPSRLYLDLPPGTRLARGVVPAAAVQRPVSGLRVGIGDGGVLRVVLELEPAATYRVARSQGGRVVAIDVAAPTVVAARTPPPPLPATGVTANALALRPRIVLDPGHGGQDPGAQGYATEKDVTLVIARELATLLRDRLNAEVVLTRTGDTTLTLAERTTFANNLKADLFLSIHANSSESQRLHGVETYYLNNTGDRATIRLAAMENGLDPLAPKEGSSELRYILSDLVQVGKLEESATLAGAVQRSLVRRLRTEYPDVGDLGVKQGPFYVLVGAYMPCALVETSFLNHPAEGRRLAGPRYQQAVVEGLAAGVEAFLANARRAQTL